MSSKALQPSLFSGRRLKLTGTCKNKIQTPNRDLGLPLLPSQTHLLSLSPLLTVQGGLGLLRVLGKLRDRDLQLSQLSAACLNSPPLPSSLRKLTGLPHALLGLQAHRDEHDQIISRKRARPVDVW